MRKLSDVELWEISIVTFPLLTGARILSPRPAQRGEGAEVRRTEAGEGPPKTSCPLPARARTLATLSRCAGEGKAEPSARATTPARLFPAGRVLHLAPFAKYSPGQPRVPAGHRDGGQWTDGGGGGNSDVGAARRGGPRGSATLSQQLRLDAARMHSEHALRRVRELDPEWKPTPSFERINSMEGVIGRREAEAREAEARYVELLRAGADPKVPQREPRPLHDVLAPGGKPIGVRSGGDSDVRTVAPASFDRIRNDLLTGAQPTRADAGYNGVWFRRRDGSVIGLRLSEQHGLTLEVIESNHRSVGPNFKVHQR